jgi:triphosphoribosyl-dephospho-CoA synthase
MLSANLEATLSHQSSTAPTILKGALRCQLLGRLASAALLAETRLTPKPALVDMRGSGAHTDLTLESMTKSALALEPFFQEMAGIALGAHPTLILLEKLAECGRRGEVAMRQATGGGNSHRGAIWCIGLLVASAAMHRVDAGTLELAQTAALLAAFRDRNAPQLDTHGEVVKRSYGVMGARAEAQLGFPHVTKIGLPHLIARRQDGAPESSCRLDAMLAIMGTLDDTCLLYRGGLPALETAKNGAREIIALGGTHTTNGMARLLQLDRELLELNASPGGSGDLLAATLFLDSLESKSNNSNQLGSVLHIS